MHLYSFISYFVLFVFLFREQNYNSFLIFPLPFSLNIYKHTFINMYYKKNIIMLILSYFN